MDQTQGMTNTERSRLQTLLTGVAVLARLISPTGDLLNNYCVTGVSAGAILANITRFVFAAIVMLTYPIECFVAREVCDCCVLSIFLFACCVLLNKFTFALFFFLGS